MKKPLVFEESITLNAGHSIILGNKPKKLDNLLIADKIFEAAGVSKESIDSFGLFSSDIDYNTYYPDVTPEEFNPAEDEFINPVFRMLSEVIVNKNFNPVDFSKPGVLKESMALLKGQTVNCDHETNIGNAIGSVSVVYWQESYKANGVLIPAGINAELKIDAKANPRIARGIMMDPPSIHSNSVTVRFLWEKSHPEMADDEFWNKLGGYDKDGVMVRKMVTKILSYHETSLVSHGADPFAQKVGTDGKINNPVYANAVYYSLSEDQKKQRFVLLDYKDLNNEETVHNTAVSNNVGNHSNNNNKNQESSMSLEQFLQSLFGNGMLTLAEGKEATTEEAVALIKQVVANNADLTAKVSTLQNTVTEKQTEVERLKGDISRDLPLVTLGNERLSSVRELTLGNYKKLSGEENVDETIIKLINDASHDVLVSLNKTYEASLDEKFPLTCSKCGSKDVNRASSLSETSEEDDDETGKAKLSDKDNKTSIKSLRSKKLKDNK